LDCLFRAVKAGRCRVGHNLGGVRISRAKHLACFLFLAFSCSGSPTWPHYTPRPPSTSMLTPVMNLPSSLAVRIVSQLRSVGLQLRLHIKSNNACDLPRNKAAFATSVGSVSRPSGTFPKKFLTFSGVNGTPTNVSNRPVPLSSGRRLLTRICLGPYSAASPLVAYPRASTCQ
jgi:hypothetical protein